MNRNKQLTINLVASILAFIINIGISFFLTPYITENIGVEAYGFVSLGTEFVNYASLVTIALNSMAGRFITIEIHKGNWEGANKYFNSVLLSNCIVAGVILFPSILVVAFLDRIIDIPVEIILDVKILFALLFTNYIISIIVSSFGVSTFATNKLHLKSMREIEARILKALLLIFLFILFEPAVSYLGFATVAMIVYISFFNIYYTKKYLPEIKLRKKYFRVNAVFELISSGIWNTVIQAGQILLQGLDLFIANIFIGSTSMGTLALAKTIPMMVLSLVSVISSVFIPDFLILYTKNNKEELLNSIKQSMKVLGIIINIPIAIIFVFGKEFFTLWVPNQNAIELQILSIITISSLIVSGPINSIYSVFTVTNRLKTNAIVVLSTGILNITIVFLLLKTTSLGLYAIAGVSTILAFISNLFFAAPFGAKYLGEKWNEFFPVVAKSIVSFLILVITGWGVKYLIIVNSWFSLFTVACLTGVIGFFVNFMVILNRKERKHIYALINNKVKKRQQF